VGKKYQKKLKDYVVQYGCSYRTILRYADQGYPLDDPAAMLEKLSAQKTVPPGLKAADGKQPPSDAAEKRENTRLKNEKLRFEIQVLRGEYTENSRIREDITRIATATRGQLLRLENDLPGVLAGLDSAAIQKIVSAKCDEIIASLNDATSNLYLPVPECPPSP